MNLGHLKYFFFRGGVSLLLIATCSSLGGCDYRNQPLNHTQQCSASTNGKRCPDNYHCASDGFCWQNGTDPDGGTSVDGNKGSGGTGGRGDGGVVTGSGGGAVNGSSGGSGTGGVSGTGGGNAAGRSGTGGADDSDGGSALDAPQVSCTTGQKRCNGACVSIDDPTYGCDPVTCDTSACPTAAGVTLVCQAFACVVGTCGTGTKKCADKCVSLTDPTYGCGAATCDTATCPAVGAGATLACQGSTCVIGTCGSGTKKCANKCVSLTDPAYGCGATTCDATSCPAAGTGTLICQGNSCVIGTCAAGTKKCGDKCVPTDANNGCGDPARCTPCAANESCTGTPVTSCQCVPNDTAACMGKACGPATNNCGTAITCKNTCTSPNTCGGGTAGVNGCGCTPNNTAACMGKACGPATNNCGTAITCTNTCVSPNTCGGGTAGVNGCGCTANNTAACSGKACGPATNNCGTAITCTNTCVSPNTCGGGTAGVNGCGCTANNSAACSGKACGPATNNCGTAITCTNTCVSPNTCGGGTAGANGCGCSTIAMSTACANKTCGTVSNGCGGNWTCGNSNGTCTAQPDATAVCQSNNCVNSCASDTTPLSCNSASSPHCGRWSFEGSGNQGWSVSDPASDGSTATSSTHYLGFQSLSAKYRGNGADLVNFLFSASLCPSAINLSGHRLTAHLMLVTKAGTTTPTSSYFYASTSVTGGDEYRAAFNDGDFTADGSWVTLSGTIPAGATSVTKVQVFLQVFQPWEGTVYLDDVRIE